MTWIKKPATPSIFDYFPYKEPRPGQEAVLRWVEKNWHKYDVMVLQAPVAAGKTGLAVTICRWAEAQFGSLCGIMAPDNVLVGQYARDFNLWRLPSRGQFASGDAFNQAREQFKRRPLKVMNYHTLLANRAYSTCQIFDEAHQLLPMLQDMEGVWAWKHLDGYPEDLKTSAEVLLWANTLPKESKLRKKFLKLLSKHPDDTTIVHERAEYRGMERERLRVYPLTPKNNAPILWPPSRVKKLILMSATIAEPDIRDLGLADYRVGYIEVPSDIPPENRPFYYAGVGSMGQTHQASSLSRALEKLDEIRGGYPGRGFIHATYGIASRMEGAPFEYISHRGDNKRRVLDRWLEDPTETRPFVGSGLTTGLDLKGDLASWQAIMKVQFPDLGDPAVMAKASKDPAWYAWQSIREVVQAYGRVCRAPDDHGDTWMLDSDFIMLWTKYRDLFPAWFRESVRIL